MAMNPTRLRWTHSGLREDGSAVDLSGLAYNLYADSAPVASFPGTLNPDGSYEQLFADLGWQPEPGRVHTLTLRALEIESGLESVDSMAVEVQFVGRPTPPAAFEAL